MNASIKKRLSSIVIAGALSGALIGAPALATVAYAAPPVGSPNAPAQDLLQVDGTIRTVGAFSGTISDLAVERVGDVLQLSGTITGEGIPDGSAGFVADIVGLEANDACTVLDLDLGPLHLDVLGLVVDLNEVELDITGVTGAGNLLGNLVCAVAGLLDNNGGGALNGISALLNRLLSGLGLAL
ncbi:hypothetical protein [Tessaracoccus sp. Z1128]